MWLQTEDASTFWPKETSNICNIDMKILASAARRRITLISVVTTELNLEDTNDDFNADRKQRKRGQHMFRSDAVAQEKNHHYVPHQVAS